MANEYVLDAEHQDYADKLSRLIESIDCINRVGKSGILSLDITRSLKAYKTEAEKLYRKIKNNEFEIAVVGMEKAGKSSFCNAIIGIDILPKKIDRCTYTSTRISYAAKDSAIVEFYTESEFNERFNNFMHEMGIEGEFFYDKLTESSFMSKFDTLDDKSKKVYTNTKDDILLIIKECNTLKKYIGQPSCSFSGEELYSEDFKDYIQAAEKAMAVKSVEIMTSRFRNMQNAVFYDVPGFDSPTKLHKEQTKKHMKDSDANIVVARGDQPSITGPLKEFFDDVDSNNVKISSKSFIFANKIDVPNTREDIKKSIDVTLRDWIITYNYIDDKRKIFFGSANAYMQSQGILKDDSFDYQGKLNANKDLLPDGSGIEAIMKALESYNQSERFEIQKQQTNELFESVKNILKPVIEEYSDVNYEDSHDSQIANLMIGLRDGFNQRKEVALDAIKEEFKNEVMDQKPLSKELREFIAENVTVEKLELTEEELKKMDLRYMTETGNKQPIKVEAALREEKFDTYYNMFIDNVVQKVEQHEKEWREKLIGILVQSLQVDSAITRQLLEKYVEEKHKPQDKGFYQSLVQRFSRDVYDILINTVYAKERYDKFEKELDNFCSLSIFFFDNNDRTYLSKPAKDLPMCKLMLFHDRNIESISNPNEADKKQITELISNKIGKAVTSNVASLISEAVLKVDIPEFIKFIDKQISKGMDDSTVRDNIRQGIALHPSIDLSKPDFLKAYGDFHNARLSEENMDAVYDRIKQDFSDDINILKEILSKAFVNAVNLEKVLGSVVLTLEEKLVKDDFGEFLSANLPKIKENELKRIRESEEELKNNKLIVEEIKNILDDLDSAS